METQVNVTFLDQCHYAIHTYSLSSLTIPTGGSMHNYAFWFPMQLCEITIATLNSYYTKTILIVFPLTMNHSPMMKMMCFRI